MPLILLFLFFCSGLATLVYEVAWLKLLAGCLSNSSHALSIVLAGFLLGLAAGARIGGEIAPAVRRPLRAYGVTECLVVAFALSMPWVLRWISEAGFSWLPVTMAQGARLLLVGGMMFVATLPIGATFPIQVACFRPAPRFALRASAFILGFQTAGGMAGVLLSGFLWLPAYGIQNTHFLGVCLSALVAAAALVLSVREPSGELAEPFPETPTTLSKRQLRALCWIVGLVGGASLGLEVLYTRALTFFLPDVAYSFSAMLSVYLFAIAVGSFVATRYAQRFLTLRGAGVIAILAGATAVLSLVVVGWLYDILHAFEQQPAGGYEPGTFMLAAFLGSATLVALPAGTLSVFLPLGIGLLAPLRGSSPSAGAAFSANSIGSSIGALLAGLVVVPLFGIKVGILLVGVLVMLAGAVLVTFAAKSGHWRRTEQVILGVSVLGCLLVLVSGGAELGRPLILDSKVFRGRLATTRGRQLLDAKEGSVTVASVVAEGERRYLFNDAFQAAGTGSDYQYMKMLGHLPMLLCPNPEQVVVIAFGTGTTAGSVSLHPTLKSLTIVEISKEVLELAPYFENVNFGLPEQSPDGVESRVVIDDGRAFLRRTEHLYDVVTLEPLMPTTPAAAHFYTRDFFELAKGKLNSQGVLCHWIPIHGQPLLALRAILKSFAAVFPDSDVYLYGSNLVLLGWQESRPLLDYPEFVRRVSAQKVQSDLEGIGLNAPEQILGGYVLDGASLRTLLDSDSLVTDDRPGILYHTIRPHIEHFLYRANGTRFLLDHALGGLPCGDRLTPATETRIQVAREVMVQKQYEEAEKLEQSYRSYLRLAADSNRAAAAAE